MKRELSELNQIKSSKPGTPLLATDWTPGEGEVLEKVVMLESFTEDAPGYYSAFVDYRGTLERATIDYNECIVSIGGEWEDAYTVEEIEAAAAKYKLNAGYY